MEMNLAKLLVCELKGNSNIFLLTQCKCAFFLLRTKREVNVKEILLSEIFRVWKKIEVDPLPKVQITDPI